MAAQQRHTGGPHPSTEGYPWQGFERMPAGSLSPQAVDLPCERGGAYERSRAYYNPPHVHDGVTLVFPRGGCARRTKTRAPARTIVRTGDPSRVVPAGVEHE